MKETCVFDDKSQLRGCVLLFLSKANKMETLPRSVLYSKNDPGFAFLNKKTSVFNIVKKT